MGQRSKLSTVSVTLVIRRPYVVGIIAIKQGNPWNKISSKQKVAIFFSLLYHTFLGIMGKEAQCRGTGLSFEIIQKVLQDELVKDKEFYR